MQRQYKNGSVWVIQFVNVKPGMDEAYMNHITGVWKTLLEAEKKDKVVLSYKVLRTEGHTADDWNMMLMAEYKDLASLEAFEAREEAIAQKVVGDDQKQQQGYKDRLEIRQITGSRVARELLLEPRP